MNREFTGVFIPAKLYLDTNLSWIEKILIVEIEALTDDEEPCKATNEHFAKHLGVSKDRVSKIISSLVKRGYIYAKIKYQNNTKKIEKRWLLVNKEYSYFHLESIGESTDRPIDENADTPIGENAEENKVNMNKVNMNNIKENTKESSETRTKAEEQEINEYNFNVIWNAYPRQEGRTKAYGYFLQWIKGRKINDKKIKLTDQQILDAVSKYAQEKKYTEQKYIQLGSTFFNTTILDYVEME